MQRLRQRHIMRLFKNSDLEIKDVDSDMFTHC